MPAGPARLPNRPDFSSNWADIIPRTLIYGGKLVPGARRQFITKERNMETKVQECQEEPRILDEIQVEELAIDGICGVY